MRCSRRRSKWFNQPVVEIKQISAYSCRGMNGQPGAHISEHAFGNALDIAAFVLADGHRITVKDGWKGSPEEQGFLRDVQGSACDQFTTVLAPGSNQFHYDHIHVDLMRRASGRRICQPGAVDGDVVASLARKNPRYASSRPIEPPPTRRYDPPVEPGSDPFAWRGDARRGDPATTGSIAARRPGVKDPAAEDLDWVEEPGPRPAIDWSTDNATRSIERRTGPTKLYRRIAVSNLSALRDLCVTRGRTMIRITLIAVATLATIAAVSPASPGWRAGPHAMPETVKIRRLDRRTKARLRDKNCAGKPLKRGYVSRAARLVTVPILAVR